MNEAVRNTALLQCGIFFDECIAASLKFMTAFFVCHHFCHKSKNEMMSYVLYDIFHAYVTLDLRSPPAD